MMWTMLIMVPVHAKANEETKADQWRQSIVQNSIESVVSVLPQLGKEQANANEPEGTGVAIGRYIVTADHVLGGANRVLIRDWQGNVSEATIYLRDSATDLALLEPTSPLTPLRLNHSTPNFGAGSDACVLGNAFGLGITLTCGIVSATGQRGVGFNFLEDFVQIDAAVNPGMSGGPVFGHDGAVMGIITAIFTKRSDGNLGVNFAVSQRLLKAFLDDAEDGRIDRPNAGLIVQNAPLPGAVGRAGGLVKVIQPHSAEHAAGIKVGDLLLAANDIKIRGQADYIAALALARQDPMIKLQLIREGDLIEIAFTATKSKIKRE